MTRRDQDDDYGDWKLMRRQEDEIIERFRRRTRLEGCAFCDSHKPGQMMPPHDASPNCESGKHSHCSCDICF